MKERSVRKERFKLQSVKKSHYSVKKGWRRYFSSTFWADGRMTVAPKGECSKSQGWRCGKCSIDFSLSSDKEFEAKFHLLLLFFFPALCWESLLPQSCIHAGLLSKKSQLHFSHWQKIPSSHVSPWSKTKWRKRGSLLNTRADIKHREEVQSKRCNQSIGSDRGYSLTSLLNRWVHWSQWLQNQQSEIVTICASVSPLFLISVHMYEAAF